MIAVLAFLSTAAFAVPAPPPDTGDTGGAWDEDGDGVPDTGEDTAGEPIDTGSDPCGEPSDADWAPPDTGTAEDPMPPEPGCDTGDEETGETDDTETVDRGGLAAGGACSTLPMSVAASTGFGALLAALVLRRSRR